MTSAQENPPLCMEAMNIRLRRWYVQKRKTVEPEIYARWRKALEAHLATCQTCQERHAWFDALAGKQEYPELTVEQIGNA